MSVDDIGSPDSRIEPENLGSNKFSEDAFIEEVEELDSDQEISTQRIMALIEE